MPRNFILTSCGTSLLNSFAKDGGLRSLIYEHANAEAKSDVPEAERAALAELIEQLSHVIETAGYKKAQDISAELNGIIKFYGGVLPGYRQAGYQIIFNLTGGFKAVQGFLQSIANFFADETVYIFEKSEMLMRIPRLPVELDAAKIVEENLACFRNLVMGVPYTGKIIIPETMILELEGTIELSAWGEVLWNEAKEQLYRDRLWPSPNPEKIRYGSGFEKSAASIDPDRLRHVNSTIDRLNRFVHDGGL